MNRAVMLLAGLALLLPPLYFLYGDDLLTRDLWSSHEARAAMNASSLAFGHGPWGVPYLFDGTAELQKPPLYYSLAALVALVRGQVDGLAVRLPATLAALGCLALLGFWLGHVRRRPLLALLATTCLATGVHFTLLARTGRIDMPLALTTLAGILGFIEATTAPRRLPWLLLAYLAIAAGLLLKGPIALALILAALLPWVLVERPVPLRELLCRWHVIPGTLLVAGLVLPWLLWIDHATHGDFFRVFLWEHNLERGLGTGRLRAYPGWYYLPLLLVNFLPWSPLLLVSLAVALARGWARTDAELRTALACFAGMLGLLSLAAFKRADYLAPLYPFAALLAAVALERLLLARWPQRAPHYATVACLAILWLAGLGQAIYTRTELARVEPLRAQAPLARTLLASQEPGEPIVQFRTESHLLAFHLGTGREILVEWNDLTRRTREARSLLVVMPHDPLAEMSIALPGILAERLADNGPHDRPLVLWRLRSCLREPPCLTSPHSRPSPTSP